MNKTIWALIAACALSACSGSSNKRAHEDMNADFDQYKNRFVEALWTVYPSWASSQGYHRWDSLLVVPNEAARERELSFARANLDSLHSYDPERLHANNRTDYHILEQQLEGIVFNITELKAYQWDPSAYNIGETFASILVNNYDTLDARLRSFGKRAASIPAYYEAAKQNIINPTKEHTQLAIDQNLGAISIFRTDLPAALAKSNLAPAEVSAILASAGAAVTSMQGYADWLKSLSHEKPRSFRLGKDLYAKKFAFDIQSRYSADEIYAKALAHKQELHREMTVIARQLWPKYMGGAPMPADSLQMIRAVIDKVSLRHVSPDSFQAAIEQQIPVLQQFVQEKNLLYIDPAKPLVVRREPDYMAGVAGASISAPGPYDTGGNTYYNVGSLSGWEPEKAESYLREYNHYILQILNIHEAIPGHYTQLVYANRSPSLIKSLLGSSSMIEGWAVYTERMMLEAGYGNNEPEMWLMYYKWNLRSTCNTILDYSVHNGDMTKEAAMNLLVNEAFQQTAEAEGKWKRVSLTQVQLCCYFTGYTEIMDLREELKKKAGSSFDLKAFHEKFLSFGSAPVKHIRELMLANPGTKTVI